MRLDRIALSAAFLLVACGSDPEPQARQPAAAGSSGSAAGQAGQPSGGSGGASSGAAGGASVAGQAGVAGSSGQTLGNGGATAGVGGSAGQAGASAGQAGVGGLGGQGGGAGEAAAGQAGASAGQAGQAGAPAVCKVMNQTCLCKTDRNPVGLGVEVCAPGSDKPTCDCAQWPPEPEKTDLTYCKGTAASDNAFMSACVGDAAYPVCRVVSKTTGADADTSWRLYNCADPIGGSVYVNGRLVQCCKGAV